MIFKLSAMAVIAAALSVLLKGMRPELAMQIGIAAGLLILLSVLELLTGIIQDILSAAEAYGLRQDSIGAAIKVIGIAYVAQFAAQSCRDCGETAIAAKVELGARVIMLALAMPVVISLLDTIHLLLEVAQP